MLHHAQGGGAGVREQVLAEFLGKKSGYLLEILLNESQTYYSEISILLSLDFIDNMGFIECPLQQTVKIKDLDFLDLLMMTNYSIKSRFHCIMI